MSRAVGKTLLALTAGLLLVTTVLCWVVDKPVCVETGAKYKYVRTWYVRCCDVTAALPKCHGKITADHRPVDGPGPKLNCTCSTALASSEEIRQEEQDYYNELVEDTDEIE